VKFP